MDFVKSLLKTKKNSQPPGTHTNNNSQQQVGDDERRVEEGEEYHELSQVEEELMDDHDDDDYYYGEDDIDDDDYDSGLHNGQGGSDGAFGTDGDNDDDDVRYFDASPESIKAFKHQRQARWEQQQQGFHAQFQMIKERRNVLKEYEAYRSRRIQREKDSNDPSSSEEEEKRYIEGFMRYRQQRKERKQQQNQPRKVQEKQKKQQKAGVNNDLEVVKGQQQSSRSPSSPSSSFIRDVFTKTFLRKNDDDNDDERHGMDNKRRAPTQQKEEDQEAVAAEKLPPSSSSSSYSSLSEEFLDDLESELLRQQQEPQQQQKHSSSSSSSNSGDSPSPPQTRSSHKNSHNKASELETMIEFLRWRRTVKEKREKGEALTEAEEAHAQSLIHAVVTGVLPASGRDESGGRGSGGGSSRGSSIQTQRMEQREGSNNKVTEEEEEGEGRTKKTKSKMKKKDAVRGLREWFEGEKQRIDAERRRRGDPSWLPPQEVQDSGRSKIRDFLQMIHGDGGGSAPPSVGRGAGSGAIDSLYGGGGSAGASSTSTPLAPSTPPSETEIQQQDRIRHSLILVTGKVQGVAFRHHVQQAVENSINKNTQQQHHHHQPPSGDTRSAKTSQMMRRLTGWVRNIKDKNRKQEKQQEQQIVEIFAEGPESAISDLVQWCKTEGSPASVVADVVEVPLDGNGNGAEELDQLIPAVRNTLQGSGLGLGLEGGDGDPQQQQRIYSSFLIASDQDRPLVPVPPPLASTISSSSLEGTKKEGEGEEEDVVHYTIDRDAYPNIADAPNTLAQIAAAHGVTVAELREANAPRLDQFGEDEALPMSMLMDDVEEEEGGDVADGRDGHAGGGGVSVEEIEHDNEDGDDEEKEEEDPVEGGRRDRPLLFQLHPDYLRVISTSSSPSSSTNTNADTEASGVDVDHADAAAVAAAKAKIEKQEKAQRIKDLIYTEHFFDGALLWHMLEDEQEEASNNYAGLSEEEEYERRVKYEIKEEYDEMFAHRLQSSFDIMKNLTKKERKSLEAFGGSIDPIEYDAFWRDHYRELFEKRSDHDELTEEDQEAFEEEVMGSASKKKKKSNENNNKNDFDENENGGDGGTGTGTGTFRHQGRRLDLNKVYPDGGSGAEYADGEKYFDTPYDKREGWDEQTRTFYNVANPPDPHLIPKKKIDQDQPSDNKELLMNNEALAEVEDDKKEDQETSTMMTTTMFDPVAHDEELKQRDRGGDLDVHHDHRQDQRAHTQQQHPPLREQYESTFTHVPMTRKERRQRAKEVLTSWEEGLAYYPKGMAELWYVQQMENEQATARALIEWETKTVPSEAHYRTIISSTSSTSVSTDRAAAWSEEPLEESSESESPHRQSDAYYREIYEKYSDLDGWLVREKKKRVKERRQRRKKLRREQEQDQIRRTRQLDEEEADTEDGDDSDGGDDGDDLDAPIIGEDDYGHDILQRRHDAFMDLLYSHVNGTKVLEGSWLVAKYGRGGDGSLGGGRREGLSTGSNGDGAIGGVVDGDDGDHHPSPIIAALPPGHPLRQLHSIPSYRAEYLLKHQQKDRVGQREGGDKKKENGSANNNKKKQKNGDEEEELLSLRRQMAADHEASFLYKHVNKYFVRPHKMTTAEKMDLVFGKGQWELLSTSPSPTTTTPQPQPRKKTTGKGTSTSTFTTSGGDYGAAALDRDETMNAASSHTQQQRVVGDVDALSLEREAEDEDGGIGDVFEEEKEEEDPNQAELERLRERLSHQQQQIAKHELKQHQKRYWKDYSTYLASHAAAFKKAGAQGKSNDDDIGGGPRDADGRRRYEYDDRLVDTLITQQLAVDRAEAQADEEKEKKQKVEDEKKESRNVKDKEQSPSTSTNREKKEYVEAYLGLRDEGDRIAFDRRRAAEERAQRRLRQDVMEHYSASSSASGGQTGDVREMYKHVQLLQQQEEEQQQHHDPLDADGKEEEEQEDNEYVIRSKEYLRKHSTTNTKYHRPFDVRKEVAGYIDVEELDDGDSDANSAHSHRKEGSREDNTPTPGGRGGVDLDRDFLSSLETDLGDHSTAEAIASYLDHSSNNNKPSGTTVTTAFEEEEHEQHYQQHQQPHQQPYIAPDGSLGGMLVDARSVAGSSSSSSGGITVGGGGAHGGVDDEDGVGGYGMGITMADGGDNDVPMTFMEYIQFRELENRRRGGSRPDIPFTRDEEQQEKTVGDGRRQRSKQHHHQDGGSRSQRQQRDKQLKQAYKEYMQQQQYSRSSDGQLQSSSPSPFGTPPSTSSFEEFQRHLDGLSPTARAALLTSVTGSGGRGGRPRGDQDEDNLIGGVGGVGDDDEIPTTTPPPFIQERMQSLRQSMEERAENRERHRRGGRDEQQDNDNAAHHGGTDDDRSSRFFASDTTSASSTTTTALIQSHRRSDTFASYAVPATSSPSRLPLVLLTSSMVVIAPMLLWAVAAVMTTRRKCGRNREKKR